MILEDFYKLKVGDKIYYDEEPVIVSMLYSMSNCENEVIKWELGFRHLNSTDHRSQTCDFKIFMKYLNFEGPKKITLYRYTVKYPEQCITQTYWTTLSAGAAIGNTGTLVKTEEKEIEF